MFKSLKCQLIGYSMDFGIWKKCSLKGLIYIYKRLVIYFIIIKSTHKCSIGADWPQNIIIYNVEQQHYVYFDDII